MRVKLISTTNEEVKQFEGEERSYKLIKDNSQVLLVRDDGHYIITSTIKSITKMTDILDKSILQIKTLNSTYMLETIDEDDDSWFGR